MNSYPSYRFHPTGLMALVRNSKEDNQLPQWGHTPPEDFVCPERAHFHAIHEIPSHLKGEDEGLGVVEVEESFEEMPPEQQVEIVDENIEQDWVARPDPAVMAAKKQTESPKKARNVNAVRGKKSGGVKF